MNDATNPIPDLPKAERYCKIWPEPAAYLLNDELPQAPKLDLSLLSPELGSWIKQAAQAANAPADYVFAALLSTTSALLSTTRWVSAWDGWEEPPLIWAMCVGLPSSGKSPAIDVALAPLREIEAAERAQAETDLRAWETKTEAAEAAKRGWLQTIEKAAAGGGNSLLDCPSVCEIAPKPVLPRRVINDVTIERLGTILAGQAMGVLMTRDELSGWLEGMTRYAKSSDRPFWIEAYGGRPYAIERASRDPLTIERLAISVLGGIQPARLNNLLLKPADDGLLARFLPVWPDPVRFQRPDTTLDSGLMLRALKKLQTLRPENGSDGGFRPKAVVLSADAARAMESFAREMQQLEGRTEGLLLSFIGKLRGVALRLALTIAYLDWALSKEGSEPTELGLLRFESAVTLVKSYFLPMARRAYAAGSMQKTEQDARRLIGLLREKEMTIFSTGEILRLGRTGLKTAKELLPVLAFLEDANIVMRVDEPPGPYGGRPSFFYQVSPRVIDLDA